MGALISMWFDRVSVGGPWIGVRLGKDPLDQEEWVHKQTRNNWYVH